MAFNDFNATPSLDTSADLFDNFSDSDDNDFHALLKKDEDVASSNTVENRQNDCNALPAISTNDFRSQHNASPSTFICPFCSATEGSVYSLELHIERAHPEFGAGEDMIKKAKETSESLDFIDLGSNQNPHNLSDSMAIEVGDSVFVCPFCDVKFDDESSLSVHFDSAHKEEMEAATSTSSNCPICNEAFMTEAELEYHVEMHLSSSSSNDVLNGACASSCSNQTPQSPQSKCPVCDFYSDDYALLVSHVENHFHPLHGSNSKNEKRPLPSMSSSVGDFNTPSTSNADHKSRRPRKPQNRRNVYQHQYRQNLEKSVFRGEICPGEYHERMSSLKSSHYLGIDEGRTKVEGLHENIASAYRKLHHQRGSKVILCDPMDYYCGSYGDKGWGCGYRNFQMMISCLSHIPIYADKLFPGGDHQVPSICKLQQMIEDAWRKGFDQEGCAQLQGKVVNTRKWIGATEVVATLASLGIKCILADFHRPSGEDGSHPRLLDWVYNYFSQPSENKPPLYLQHQGHSRTIAGVEMDKGVIKLILFDPITPYDRLAPIAQRPLDPKQLRSFRRTLAGFKARQYQIVAVVGTLTPAEHEANKILYSTQVS